MIVLLYIIFIIPILILLPTKVTGRKNLPKDTNFIFTCNHLSNWDPIIIEARTYRKYFILSKAELFKNKLLGWFLRTLHAFPVNRGGNDIESVKYTLRNLKEGKRSLLIFPEGTRSKNSEYMEVKNGTALFALKTKKSIVPAVYFKKNKLFCKNKLIIGKPYNLSEMEDFKDKKIDKDLLNMASNIIVQKIIELKSSYTKESNMLSDIEIASKVKKQNIVKVAKQIGLKRSDLELYGSYKAKIVPNKLNPCGKLILVTAINPTSAGEGKTTMSIGLADGLKLIHKKVCLALREPSLGPVFGIKGGATGGGYSQVVPMDDINLHFTGDFHAITSANNLLSAMIDNHIHQGNELDIDVNNICFKRCLDLNDRALREVECALGGKTNGIPRKDGFNITSASETMAIMCLAKDIDDLKYRLGNILVGFSKAGKPIYARDLHAENAMAILLKDAIKPNLVQTLIGTPAIVHLGPFANIAHGCNSITATKLSMTHADYTVTEAGFGADLGAEKFLDVKCRVADIKPNAVVVVATIRALKLHGGADKTNLSTPDVDACIKGLPNLEKHLSNIKNVYHLPVVCAINKFISDSEEEINCVKDACNNLGVESYVCDVFTKGGKGAIELAKKVVKMCEEDNSGFEFSYNTQDDIKTKILKVAQKIYGANGVVYTQQAEEDIKKISKLNISGYPVVIAKTQYSLSDDKDKLGAPKDFDITINEVQLRNGAGFIVPVAGSMLLMPGLSKKPAAVSMTIDNQSKITGLF